MNDDPVNGARGTLHERAESQHQDRRHACPYERPAEDIARVVRASVDASEAHDGGEHKRRDPASSMSKHEHRGDRECRRGVVARERRITAS